MITAASAVAGAARRAVAAIEEDFELDWPLFLGWTAGVGVLVVVLARWIQALGLRSGRLLVNLLGVAPAVVIAAMTVVLLAWVYWRIRLDPEDRSPYMLAVLAAVMTVGVCIEAFAGVTTLLWQRGLLAPAAADTPGLWATEQYYLWHLVDAIPLLRIPQTIAWAPPVVFTDVTSGALSLAFKLVLIVPLVRVAMAGYSLAKSLWLSHAETLADRRDRHQTTWHSLFGVGEWVGTTAMFVAAPALAYGGLVLLGRGHAAVDQWVIERIEGATAGAGFAVPVGWIPVALDVVVTTVFVGLVWSLTSQLLLQIGVLLEPATSKRHLLFASVLFLWLLVLGVLCVAAVTVTLLHAGIARADPPVVAPGDVSAVVEWYAWHLTGVIPVLDIPQSMNWVLPTQLVDGLSGGMLLALKLAFVAVLAGPVALAMQGAQLQAARRRQTPGDLAAVQRAPALLRQVQRDLATVQAQVTVPDEDQSLQRVYVALAAVRHGLRTVAGAQRQLSAVFGAGAATMALRDVVAALHEWADAVGETRWRLSGTRREDPARAQARRELDAQREEVARLLVTFEDAARAALVDAAAWR